MTCEETQSFLQDYVTGALSEPARAVVESHVTGCAPCRSDVDGYRRVDRHLAAAPMREVPSGLVDRIVAATAPAATSRVRREWLRVAAAVAVAAGLGAAFVLGGMQEGEAAGQLAETGRTFLTSIREAVSAAGDLAVQMKN